jgi:NAD(P)-dependent dehydrogenase (short-subunit alcohol dehydrogenase family)
VFANISSGAALYGYGGWTLYCAAKAGLENFIRALATEQKMEAHPFIAVNINPGVMDTEMQALIRATSAADFPDVGRFVHRKEQGELALPDGVAAAIMRIVESAALESGARYNSADYMED